MRKRDKFALKAFPVVLKVMNEYGKKHKQIVEYSTVARTCYIYADAMIKASKQ